MRVMWPMLPTFQDPSSGPSNMVTPGRAPWYSQSILHELGSGRLKQRGKEIESIYNGNSTSLGKHLDEGRREDKNMQEVGPKGHLGDSHRGRTKTHGGSTATARAGVLPPRTLQKEIPNFCLYPTLSDPSFIFITPGQQFL